jgi:hypothetical protein
MATKCTNAMARKRTLSILPAVLEGLTGREIQIRSAYDPRLAWTGELCETTLHRYMARARRMAADRENRGPVAAEVLRELTATRRRLDVMAAALALVGIGFHE